MMRRIFTALIYMVPVVMLVVLTALTIWFFQSKMPANALGWIIAGGVAFIFYVMCFALMALTHGLFKDEWRS